MTVLSWDQTILSVQHCYFPFWPGMVCQVNCWSSDEHCEWPIIKHSWWVHVPFTQWLTLPMRHCTESVCRELFAEFIYEVEQFLVVLWLGWGWYSSQFARANFVCRWWRWWLWDVTMRNRIVRWSISSDSNMHIYRNKFNELKTSDLEVNSWSLWLNLNTIRCDQR